LAGAGWVFKAFQSSQVREHSVAPG